MNKAIIIGNLGRDPELTYTPQGRAVAKFTVAVNRRYKDSAGERKEETQWFQVTAWGELANICATYLHKGSKVYIDGRLQTREFTDREGRQRMAVEIVANDMEMLDPKGDTGGTTGGTRPASSTPDSSDGMSEDEIPF